MAIVKVDPFRELVAMQDRIGRFFGDVYVRDEDTGFRGTWTPAVDIYEIEGTLVLKAELPDLRREDIDVSVENSTLTIRGERKLDNDIKQENFHRIERPYGSFLRQFSLPPTVDTSRIGADYRNGVLTVKLPVREEAKPRTINVEEAA